MTKEYISIQKAASLSRKSVQTIRRAIKAKKIQIKKRKTPQGFNYLIGKSSLEKLYKFKIETAAPKEKIIKHKLAPAGKKMTIETSDFKAFVGSMEAMMAKHNEERDNFLRLINTMQEKIFVLENQLNLLKAPSKQWYQFWK